MGHITKVLVLEVLNEEDKEIIKHLEEQEPITYEVSRDFSETIGEHYEFDTLPEKVKTLIKNKYGEVDEVFIQH